MDITKNMLKTEFPLEKEVKWAMYLSSGHRKETKNSRKF